MNKHVLLLLASAILWSLGGVLIKSIDWTPVAIAGARSLIAMLIIGLAMPGVVRKISWQSVPGALAYSATVILFVVASLQGLSGVIAALGSGVAFAWLTVLMRQQRAGSPEAVVLLGNGVTLLFALPWMFPVMKIQQNGPWLLVLGSVQLAIPYLLYSLAIRHVRALDASIISIIEPILNPIWVMLVTSEHPSFWSIVGGSVVLATSLTRSLIASRHGHPTNSLPNA